MTAQISRSRSKGSREMALIFANRCLRCGHGFESEGIHNRMCAPCRLQATADSDAPFSFGAIHGRKRSA
jgi:hypothetical protein